MPTKRCCCGCFTYLENWVRPPDDDPEDLEPDWQACGDWTDWTIGGELVNTVANAKIVLKHMVGNPYGILTGKVYGREGDIFRIYVFKGSEASPCGSENIYVEIDFSDSDTDGWLRIKQGSTVLEETNINATTNELEFNVCAGENSIEASMESTSIIRHCGTATNHWFALESVVIGQRWGFVNYSDHFNHNRTCPKCSRPCCFPDFDEVITGFHVTVHNIGDDAGTCECAESMEFDVNIPPDTDKCKCELQFYTNPTADPLEETTPGPHGCPYGETIVQFSMSCNTTDICISIDLILDGPTQSEYNYEPRCFPVGTDPRDLVVTSGDPIVISASGLGDEALCIMENSYITLVPIVSSGCCTEDIIEVSEITEVSGIKRQLTRRPGIRVSELPYEEHDQLIDQLRREASSQDRGLGDTCSRLLKAKHPLSHQIRRWLKVYSCSRGEAVKATNRQFPAKPQ